MWHEVHTSYRRLPPTNYFELERSGCDRDKVCHSVASHWTIGWSGDCARTLIHSGLTVTGSRFGVEGRRSVKPVRITDVCMTAKTAATTPAQ